MHSLQGFFLLFVLFMISFRIFLLHMLMLFFMFPLALVFLSGKIKSFFMISNAFWKHLLWDSNSSVKATDTDWVVRLTTMLLKDPEVVCSMILFASVRSC